MTEKLPNRRPCVTEEIGMGISVTVSFHPETMEPIEVFLSQRGKASDNPMQEALYNLGVAASNLMQGEGQELLSLKDFMKSASNQT